MVSCVPWRRALILVAGPGVEGDDEHPFEPEVKFWTKPEGDQRGMIMLEWCGCWGGYLVKCYNAAGWKENLDCPEANINRQQPGLKCANKLEKYTKQSMAEQKKEYFG